ncbi:uncharacterized protein LOC142817505 [Rhipicephalus microplus]|uniref:uncharacterized protein LOC142817505 n=1 Tax=Rhipicephalus microplus TaxID=6941 RepID=UPI003F6B3F42
MHCIKRNAAKWKPFAANRVSELQALTDPKCDSLKSVSTITVIVIPRIGDTAPEWTTPLIGILPSALLESELWWTGPHWLHKNETHSPRTSEPSSRTGECHLEERKVTVMIIVSSLLEAVLKVEEFRAFSRVVRVNAWVRRFVNNCGHGDERQGGPLRAEEVIDSEKNWLVAIQVEAFSDDISNTKAQIPLHKGSLVLPLNPYLDGEGLMRVGGRLQFTENPKETKHPIILPSTDSFTLLLIRKEHVRMQHSGVRDTLTQLRELY